MALFRVFYTNMLFLTYLLEVIQHSSLFLFFFFVQQKGDSNMSEVIFSVFPSENFIDLGLYQFGWEKCDPSHSFGPAARNHYLFHYCISGTGILYSNNAKGVSIPYAVKSGQGFVCFPNQINMYIADREIPWEYVWIEFDGLRAKETIELTGLSPDQPVYKARYKDLAEAMKSEMLYIVV